jgi:hypothetical protein
LYEFAGTPFPRERHVSCPETALQEVGRTKNGKSALRRESHQRPFGSGSPSQWAFPSTNDSRRRITASCHAERRSRVPVRRSSHLTAENNSGLLHMSKVTIRTVPLRFCCPEIRPHAGERQKVGGHPVYL